MAGITTGYPPRHVGPDRVWITGSFVCNGASAVTTIRGDGFSVTKEAGTGLWTITLACGRVAAADALVVELAQASSAAAKVIALNDWHADLIATGTFQVEGQSAAGTEADLDNTHEVSFILCVNNTGSRRRAGA